MVVGTDCVTKAELSTTAVWLVCAVANPVTAEIKKIKMANLKIDLFNI
jgi:hypothetical protein